MDGPIKVVGISIAASSPGIVAGAVRHWARTAGLAVTAGAQVQFLDGEAVAGRELVARMPKDAPVNPFSVVERTFEFSINIKNGKGRSRRTRIFTSIAIHLEISICY
jgi:hypothetical protein